MQVKHGLYNDLNLLQLHLFVAVCLYSWCVNDMHKAVGILVCLLLQAWGRQLAQAAPKSHSARHCAPFCTPKVLFCLL